MTIIGPRPPQLPGRGLGGDRGRPIRRPGFPPILGGIPRTPPPMLPMPVIRGDAGIPPGAGTVAPGPFGRDEPITLPPDFPPRTPFRPHPIDIQDIWDRLNGQPPPYFGGRDRVPGLGGRPPGPRIVPPGFAAQVPFPDPFGIGRERAGYINDYGGGDQDMMDRLRMLLFTSMLGRM